MRYDTRTKKKTKKGYTAGHPMARLPPTQTNSLSRIHKRQPQTPYWSESIQSCTGSPEEGLPSATITGGAFAASIAASFSVRSWRVARSAASRALWALDYTTRTQRKTTARRRVAWTCWDTRHNHKRRGQKNSSIIRHVSTLSQHSIAHSARFAKTPKTPNPALDTAHKSTSEGAQLTMPAGTTLPATHGVAAPPDSHRRAQRYQPPRPHTATKKAVTRARPIPHNVPP